MNLNWISPKVFLFSCMVLTGVSMFLFVCMTSYVFISALEQI